MASNPLMADLLRSSLAPLLVAFPLVVAAACSTTITNNPATPEDAGVDAAVDDDGAADAAPDTSDLVDPTYPTAHTPMPLVDWNGGRVMTAPKIVTVTFGSDTQRGQLEQLGDTLTSSAWWDAVSSGYCAGTKCIGKGSGGGHVNIPTTGLATSFTDSSQGQASSIQEYLQARIADGTLPQPTEETLYVVYLPAAVSITLDGASSCREFGGYHNTLTYTPEAGAAIPVPYAIVPRCDSTTTTTTIAASHEIIEAATDPDVGNTNVAYYMVNEAWAFAGGEVGDLCVDFTGGGTDTVLEGAFTVQRSWSNTEAKAGHDPCVPAPANDVFFGAAPAAAQQKVVLAAGKSVVIDVTAFSNGPMADFTLSAVDFGLFTTGSSHLSFSFDKTTVHNGSKVQLTVTMKTAPPRGSAFYGIVATSGKKKHFWPAAVVTR
jgi:hypothetical protein